MVYDREIKEILNVVLDSISSIEGRLKIKEKWVVATQNISVGTAVSSYVLSKDSILQAVYIYGQATGETDTLTVKDSVGNVYYQTTASAMPNMYIPAGWSISVVATGVSSPTGKCNYMLLM